MFRRIAGKMLNLTPAPPPISAQAAFVLASDTALPVFAKSADRRLPPGSIVKLATAMLLSERSQGRWNEPVEIVASDLLPGSTMGLREGERVTRMDLLHGMLLPSGNDAAMVAARLIGADWRERLKALTAGLGMNRSTFLNPHGRDVRGQLGTARDLARLAAAAFGDPVIRQVAGTRTYRFNGREIVSTVQLLGEPHVIAGKTGTTARAGGCLVLAVTGHTICILGSAGTFVHNNMAPGTDRRYDDARKIIAALPLGQEAMAPGFEASQVPR